MEDTIYIDEGITTYRTNAFPSHASHASSSHCILTCGICGGHVHVLPVCGEEAAEDEDEEEAKGQC